MLHFAGVTFHLYGLLVGLGLVVTISLVELKLKTSSFKASEFWPAVMAMGVGAIIGARLYHVVSDWSFYQDNINLTWQIWRGGLSIIGAVLGGLLVLVGWAKGRGWSSHQGWLLLDAMAFGLPFGQAVGRLGNFVNQELYGPPTTLPWGIPIDPAHRLASYQSATHFHPLFAYELLPLLFFGGLLWKWGRWPLGSGVYFWLYLTYYAGLRFGLDFLRLDKVTLGIGLGSNQLVMLILFMVSSFTLVKKILHTKPFSRTMDQGHGS